MVIRFHLILFFVILTASLKAQCDSSKDAGQVYAALKMDEAFPFLAGTPVLSSAKAGPGIAEHHQKGHYKGILCAAKR